MTSSNNQKEVTLNIEYVAKQLGTTVEYLLEAYGSEEEVSKKYLNNELQVLND